MKKTPEQTDQTRYGRWKTAWIVLGSALLGGLTVAIWNRKSLAALREMEAAVGPVKEREEEGIY